MAELIIYERPLVWAAFGILTVASFGLGMSAPSSDQFAMIGTQGLGKRLYGAPSAHAPRINVLEVDVWRHSLEDGSLQPFANVPFARHELIHPAHFSPSYYQSQIARLGDTYARQRDVLMYYGGLPVQTKRHGLNFNGWSVSDLEHLRVSGSRPFIGLETTDPKAIEWMAGHLHDAGYGPMNRIYVRICSEPSGMSYGSDDGTAKGKFHTQASYSAYQRRFSDVAHQLRAFNRRYGLDLYIVFAGTTAEDFHHYMPQAGVFDALGYDLYVTPENKEKVIQQITELRQHLPEKSIVIPEFGIATAGPGASPHWAEDTLGDMLMSLGQHPAGIAGVTVFSVNVAGRLPHKRWSWAWTPRMFETLKEWEGSPRRWSKNGFHRYNPLSYPIGRDVLYLDRPDLRIVYRKLATVKSPGVPYFYEVRLFLHRGHWIHRTRTIAIE